MLTSKAWVAVSLSSWHSSNTRNPGQILRQGRRRVLELHCCAHLAPQCLHTGRRGHHQQVVDIDDETGINASVAKRPTGALNHLPILCKYIGLRNLGMEWATSTNQLPGPHSMGKSTQVGTRPEPSMWACMYA